MKAIRLGGLFVLAMVFVQAAVLQATAEDKAQKQKDINKMAQATLQQLYKAQPKAKLWGRKGVWLRRLQQHGREDPLSGFW